MFGQHVRYLRNVTFRVGYLLIAPRGSEFVNLQYSIGLVGDVSMSCEHSSMPEPGTALWRLTPLDIFRPGEGADLCVCQEQWRFELLVRKTGGRDGSVLLIFTAEFLRNARRSGRIVVCSACRKGVVGNV